MIAKEQAIYIANLFYRAAPAATALFYHFLSMMSHHRAATDERPNDWTNEDRYYWELSHRIFACKIIKRYGGAFAFQEDNNNINKGAILVKPTKETYYCWWHGEIGRTMCVKHILLINLLICENLSLI